MTVPTSKSSGKRPSKDDLLQESDNTGYFKSKEHEIAFYFKLNHPEFDIRLGIKRVHQLDVEKARELRKVYLSMFHSDTNEDSASGLSCDEICADINAVFYRVSGGKL